MKICSINTAEINLHKNNHHSTKKLIVAQNYNIDNNKQKVYASNLNFKASNSAPQALINEYRGLIYNEKIPPIEAFLKLNAPKETLEKMFNYIIANDETSWSFINSIVSLPRLNKNYRDALVEKLPENSSALNFYDSNNAYTNAYKKYIERRYKNAQSVSELLKIRPDWSEEALLKKHQELYYNNEFELGSIPESIGKDNYYSIIDHLRKHFDYGFKVSSSIEDLTLYGQTYKFKKFIDGKSDKNVFLIETPSSEKYVIKLGDCANSGLNKPFAIGTCAIIDTYLTQNNCRNSAPIRYYNHDTNSAIYDFVEHKHTSKIYQLTDFTHNMPDFEDLGLKHNDMVGNNNYFLLDTEQKAMKNTYDFEYGVEHGEYISVDNDHVNYTQPLNPKIQGYHIYLPNAMQMCF